MENKVIKLAEGMVALSFSAEPNPAVIDAVRTTHDPPHICRLQPLL